MIRLVTLGRLELTQDGNPLLVGRRKLLTVLVYVARARGRPVSRGQLGLLFWPVEDDVRARRSVRQALTDLRRAVGPVLEERAEGVAIVSGEIALDAAELEQAVAAEELERAAALWEGDFLAGAEDLAGLDLRVWIESERQGIRARLAIALDHLIEIAERRGAWETGLGYARKSVAALPHDPGALARYQRLEELASRPSGRKAVRSPAGPGLLSPDLVGRENEFAALTELWGRVARGEGGVARIEGDDGFGKTRLAEELLRWVRLESPRPVVIQARAFEAEQNRPRLLLRYLLAGLAGAAGLGAAPPAMLGVLAGLAPEIAERFPTVPLEPAGDLVEAVGRALQEVAAEQPVLVVVDDAHLADPESRQILEGLCRHPSAGTLLVLTTTPGALASELGGASARIDLGPLSRGEIDDLLAGMAEFVPDDRRAIAARLSAESEGNPLVAIELVTGLADRGVIAPREDGLWSLQSSLDREPLSAVGSVQATAVQRLGLLPRDALELLRAVAVLERDAELEQLGLVARLSAPRLEEALDQLIGRRFLRPAGAQSDRVEFSHETVRHAVYDAIPPTQRGKLHARAWSALRDGAGPDPARRQAAAHHRLRMTGLRARHAAWVAIAVMAVGAGSVALALGDRGPPPSAGKVVVLPFEVRGNDTRGNLSEGMVTRLGAALDGLGGLSVTTERARAGRVVRGTVVETGGRIDLEATLSDARGRPQSEAHASAPDEAGLTAAAEELAKQLVLGGSDLPREEAARTAAGSTASLAALKSYLQGERQLREGSFGPAVESFQGAVRLDSAFALAYYRLAIAAEWDMRSDRLTGPAAREAVRHSDGLTLRARTLLRGLAEWRNGDPRVAKASFDEIVTRYPDDLEAWFQLAEVLFHAGPMLGLPLGQAKSAWQEVRRLEPENRFALLHLARIAGAESDSAAIRSLVPKLPPLDLDGDRRLLELAAWRALLLHDDSELRRVVEAMRRNIPSGSTVWQLATYSRDPIGLLRLVGELRGQVTFRWESLLLPMAVSRGRFAEADSLLDRTEESATEALITRSFLASLPFAPHTPPALRNARDRLLRWRPDPPASHLSSGYGIVHPQLRYYFLSTLSARLGDYRAAGEYAEALGRLPVPAGAADLVRDLGIGLRARVLRGTGRARQALQVLDSLGLRATPEEIFSSPLNSRALERWDRAELLQQLGRPEEALAWYQGMAQLSLYDVTFLGPSYLRRAEIAESLHRGAEAGELYGRFVELWSQADPALQPAVTQARSKVAAANVR